MLLTDLKAGSAISFVINVGDSQYEFPSNVAVVYPDSILIPCFVINGSVVDFGDKRYGKMSFTIYYADNKSGQRLAFRGVSLETVNPHNNQADTPYYKVKSSGFAALAKVSERRGNRRVIVDLSGSITVENSGRSLNVTIHDISSSGISFYCNESLNFSSNICYIFLRDTINSHEFDLRIKSKIVRFLDNDGTYLYGCSVAENNKDYYSYVCLKQSEAKYISAHTDEQPAPLNTEVTHESDTGTVSSKTSSELSDDELFQEMFGDSPTKRSQFFSSRNKL
ncbi:MAG: PilZ domain-containing protein [Lachnospira sp.]